MKKLKIILLLVALSVLYVLGYGVLRFQGYFVNREIVAFDVPEVDFKLLPYKWVIANQEGRGWLMDFYTPMRNLELVIFDKDHFPSEVRKMRWVKESFPEDYQKIVKAHPDFETEYGLKE